MKAPFRLDRIATDDFHPRDFSQNYFHEWAYYDLLIRFFGKEFRFHFSEWNVEKIHEFDQENQKWVERDKYKAH